MSKILPSFNNQRGVMPLLLLVAALGVIGFLGLSSFAPFRDKLLSVLNRKPDSFASSVSDTKYDAGVLVLKYYPTDSSGQNLNANITGVGGAISDIRNKVNDLTTQGITQMTAGSKYHGYKDSSVTPAINYQVVDTKEYLEALPISANRIPWNPSVFRPDYQKILTRENICDYVDNRGVKQVWLWGYHYGDIEPAESNMAMGTDSQSFWNGSGYGDVSNSERINDMPTCKKTYTLYNYNYGRGLGELLEDHGHQIESVFRFVDNSLWDKFQKPNGVTDQSVVNHCGWTHSPPNSGDWSGDRGQYDWNDKTVVKSDCEDWKPEGGGVVKEVNCNTWYEPFYKTSYSDIACQDDLGAAFKVWWMQNIPGRANDLTYQNKSLRNWWDFYGDFDKALAQGKSLTFNPVQSPSPTPSPSPSPSAKIKIISPNGGETFKVGDKVTIKWEGTGRTAYNIGWSTGPGSLNPITFISDGSATSYDWIADVGNMLPGTSQQVKINILSYPQGGGHTDESDNFFTVNKPPAITGAITTAPASCIFIGDACKTTVKYTLSDPNAANIQVKIRETGAILYGFKKGSNGAWATSVPLTYKFPSLTFDLYSGSSLLSSAKAYGEEDPQIESSVSVVPSPANSTKSVNLKADILSKRNIDSTVTLAIRDLNGKSIASKTLSNQQFYANQTKSISADIDIPASTIDGLYIVYLTIVKTGDDKLYYYNNKNAAQFNINQTQFLAQATTDQSQIKPGGTININTVTTISVDHALRVVIQVVDADGKNRFSKAFDNQTFIAGEPKTLTALWKTSTSSPLGAYTIKVIFQRAASPITYSTVNAGQFMIAQ